MASTLAESRRDAHFVSGLCIGGDLVACEQGEYTMKRLLLYTDEPILECGLAAVLTKSNEIVLDHTCREASELVQAASERQPDLLLFDLTPETDIRILRELARVAPNCRVVLWTRDISTELAYQVIEMGVRGVLSTTSSAAMVIHCLEIVAEGELWMERALTMNLLTTKPVVLTKRQSQLVGLLAQGLKNKEIATALGISEGTVKAYLTRLFEKVGAKDRFELALFGLKNLKNLKTMRPMERSANTSSALRSIVVSWPSERRNTA